MSEEQIRVNRWWVPRDDGSSVMHIQVEAEGESAEHISRAVDDLASMQEHPPPKDDDDE